jgi:hypothetical protein
MTTRHADLQLMEKVDSFEQTFQRELLKATQGGISLTCFQNVLQSNIDYFHSVDREF